MVESMSKVEGSILSGLIGLAVGMILSVLLSYSIQITELNNILVTSCVKSTPEKLSISLFGKHVTISCTNGEVHVYSLLNNWNHTKNNDDGK